MEESRRQSIILYICIGILIPIIVALIPYGIQYIFPKHDLNYSILSKTQVINYTAIALEVTNNGEQIEKNTEVWIKKSEVYLGEDNQGRLDPLIDINPEIPFKVLKNKKFYVVALGNLRPNEKLRLSMLVDEFSILNDKESVIVKSEENIARLNEPSEFLQLAYPITFWLFILLITVSVIGGIYLDYFENPKKREARLLKEIDKLKR